MSFFPRRELKRLDRKIGWFCIAFVGCIISFLSFLFFSFLLGSVAGIFLFLSVCGVVGISVVLARALEQRRNLELQVRNELVRRKRGF